ncbi:MAG TPA: uroporphyrinogen-III synthase [Pyrinomonadaceae bacterium]|nr:uroporphyrinogen-III synthase [Pyrinomonadaceae bacterium]
MSEILVIREFDQFSSILIEQGFSLINFPTIKTEPVSDLGDLDKSIAQIEFFDGIFITSSKAAEVFLERFKRKNSKIKFYVLGKKANDLLESAGFETFFDENVKSAVELINLIPKGELDGKNFLFLRGSRSLRVIPEMLEGIAEVKEVIVYQTVAADFDEEKFDKIKRKFAEREIAAVCFFSPSGVEEFLAKFEDFSQDDAKIASIGQTTAKFIEENNLRVDFIAAKPSAKTFADGLAEYLRKNEFE